MKEEKYGREYKSRDRAKIVYIMRGE